jgi:hypothetical protein
MQKEVKKKRVYFLVSYEFAMVEEINFNDLLCCSRRSHLTEILESSKLTAKDPYPSCTLLPTLRVDFHIQIELVASHILPGHSTSFPPFRIPT